MVDPIGRLGGDLASCFLLQLRIERGSLPIGYGNSLKTARRARRQSTRAPLRYLKRRCRRVRFRRYQSRSHSCACPHRAPSGQGGRPQSRRRQLVPSHLKAKPTQTRERTIFRVGRLVSATNVSNLRDSGRTFHLTPTAGLADFRSPQILFPFYFDASFFD